jgi:predicted lipoprotein with Yx(FWY)xxD motif
MKHSTYLGRSIVVAAGVLALAGAGIAGATTEPTEPPDDTAAATDTAMAGTEPAAGGGPSDCPPIPAAAPGTEAPGATDAMGTEPAGTDAMGTEPAGTEAMGTEPEGTEAMGTEPAGTEAMGTEAAAAGPFVQIAESDEYGEILVDSQCRALYGFTPDVDGEPTCVDDCAAAWPPLFVEGDAVPPVADELDPALFSIVEHAEGPMLKVGDWPLYYFAEDTAPGDINGQGVGGVWWLVAPDGTLIEEAAEGTEAADGTEAAPGTEAGDTMVEDTGAPTTTG